jgi:periplasmic divalent cation tolerance protein
VVIWTTLDDEARAAELARQIVAARLAACVQRFAIQSTYWWQGKIETAGEWVLAAKTRAALEEELIRFIREHHPYEVPEIISLPIGSGWDPYLKWIVRETQAQPGASG